MNIAKYLNQKFCHLHVHSEYSPQDAPASLEGLVGYAKDLGYKSLAVTDHGTLSSWVKFQHFCNSKDVKPIFGIESYFTPDRNVRKTRKDNYHLLLLAKNNEGVKNLYRLSELGYSEGFYYEPRIDWELLEKYSEGLVCTSACISGIVPRTFERLGEEEAQKVARRFHSIFGQDFYIEIQHHRLDSEKIYSSMAKLANDLNINVVGTNDVHYLRKKDWGVQEAMMSLMTGRCIKDKTRLSLNTAQFYLKSPDEMLELFGGSKAVAVESALEIMDKCNAEITMGKTQLPSVKIPEEDLSEFEYLKRLAVEGLEVRGKHKDKIYQERLESELNVIKKLREEKGLLFDRYFLIVADYVNWAWENDIRVGVGRGSGAGSLVLYCLKVTGIDPIPYGLLFERFLSEDRIQMPDIDIDFDSEQASKVLDYINEKYGSDRCARIGTIGFYQPASAIKAAFRLFDPGNMYEAKLKEKQKAEQRKKRGERAVNSKEKKLDETNRLANLATKMLPRHRHGDKAPDPRCTLRKDVYDKNPDEKIYAYDKSSELRDKKLQYPEMFRIAEKFEGLVERHGTHAAGVLITECPTIEFAPQQYVGRQKTMATSFDMDDVEKIGGIKFDFLRTKVLAVISRCLKQIKTRHGEDIQIDDLVPNDPLVFNLFSRGDTNGIFQFESDGMKNLLRKMVPDSFEEIIAANALFRPGPMEHIDSYVNRKHGRTRVSYDAEVISTVLKPTYGIMVYQEQVMQIVRLLAGFSGAEADKVRKAMGKKKKEVLDSMRSKFLDGCESTGKCSKQVAQKIWGDMESFASYAFNKSHAAGYGYTAYQCAFLKHYYPVEFMASQLTVEGSDAKYDVVAKYEKNLAKMKIKLLPLDLNESGMEYKPIGFESSSIRRGFNGLKGIGPDAARDIVKGQPYKNMYDFCFRAGSGTKGDVVRSLVSLGVFDWLIPDLKKKSTDGSAKRYDLVLEFEAMMKRSKMERNIKGAIKEERTGMKSLF